MKMLNAQDAPLSRTKNDCAKLKKLTTDRGEKGKENKMLFRARELRKNSTEVENYLWYLLGNRNLAGYKFRRQYVIEPYIVDFVCLRKKLIIELDGSQHYDARPYDEKRTAFLQTKGYKVIRFWNNVVFTDTAEVIDAILDALLPPL